MGYKDFFYVYTGNMNTPDLITILGNVAQSLVPIQKLISGTAYLLGLIFVIISLGKFRKLAGSHSGEQPFPAIAYLAGGMMLIFLPTTISIFANTTFGTGNVLAYVKFNKINFMTVMGIIIETVGIFWAIRGCIMMISAGRPGEQEGLKGLVFLIAGILAIHFDNTIAFLNYLLHLLTTITLSVRKG